MEASQGLFNISGEKLIWIGIKVSLFQKCLIVWTELDCFDLNLLYSKARC